jgi:hypothetical protein
VRTTKSRRSTSGYAERVGSPTLVQVAEASWSEPAVGIRGGVGYEPVAVTPGNLRAVGFADLRAGSAFLEERWLTDEMAAGRTKLSGIHRRG